MKSSLKTGEQAFCSPVFIVFFSLYLVFYHLHMHIPDMLITISKGVPKWKF